MDWAYTADALPEDLGWDRQPNLIMLAIDNSALFPDHPDLATTTCEGFYQAKTWFYKVGFTIAGDVYAWAQHPEPPPRKVSAC